MARPKAKQLTERELEIMHVFWQQDACGVAEVQQNLEESGRPLAYTTVSTLVKILEEKGFLEQVNDQRPYQFQAVRSFSEVSGRLISDLIERVFGGSREALLTRLFDPGQISAKERKLIESLLEQQPPEPSKQTGKSKRKPPRSS
ncbi:BlaI/MecI/CopY family transcriptional regulator [Blastopirellula marina]|uniref:CopY family transcriptional regulator n=1 Tax=Blastopirellula marina TaxID=124 RepID=A0A2S8F9A4_9BACT|nr:BlaI/MecI/CopY family transcriptional regulator [Blastopirellula marina]PQO28743.1 CopY family transcriptional regulator [Blastopirellula marina]PTL42016.1 BlaI/MecI/CopY family transcriptional regulator [Blastopirellula marina]